MKNFFFIHKYKVFSETENKKSIMTIILVICQARDTKSLKKYFFRVFYCYMKEFINKIINFFVRGKLLLYVSLFLKNFRFKDDKKENFQ